MDAVAWFEAMGALASERAWEDMEHDEVPRRAFTGAEVRARLAKMAADDERPLPDVAGVIGDEHVAAFSRGFWRDFDDRERCDAERAFERSCEAYYGGEEPYTSEERRAASLRRL